MGRLRGWRRIRWPPRLSITPITGTAFSGAGTVANGVLSQISLSAPTGALWECGGYRGVTRGIAYRIAEQCVWRSFVFWGTSDNFGSHRAVVSIYRRASRRASGSVFCRVGNAARSRADCIDKL